MLTALTFSGIVNNMPRRNRNREQQINNTPQNPTTPEQADQRGRLRRVVTKLGKYPLQRARATGAFLKEDAKKTAYEFTHPELGVMDMALGALLIGVPVGAAYSAVKMPEWIHAGRQWFEKNVMKISDEVKDWLFLDSLESYATGAQWTRQTMGAVKAKK